MPYFLSNIYRRCALAESFIFIFIPIIFSGILSLLENDKKEFFLLFIVGYIGAFLSHFTMALYFSIFLFIFLLFYRKKTFTKEFVKPFVLATIAVILIIFPLIEPMLTHKLFGNYVVFQEGTMYKRISSTALTLLDYLNPYPILEASDTKYHLLLITSFLLLGTIIFRKKIEFPKYSKGMILFGSIAFWLSSVAFPWIIMPSFLKMIQFPWRLVTFVSFSISLIAPSFFTAVQKSKKVVEILFLIIITATSFQTISYSTDEYIDENNIWWNGGMGWQREYLPINMKNNLSYYYKRDSSILIQNNKNANISILENNIPNLTFEITNLTEQVTIELPRIFYFGYRLFSADKQIELYENSKGFLETTIEEEGIYTLTYEGTLVGKIAKIGSIATGIILIVITIKNKFQEKARSL